MPDFDILKTQFKDHCRENERFSTMISLSMKELGMKVSLIKDNHLVHVQSDLSEIKSEVAIIKNNQKWMMGLGGLIGGGVSGIIMTIVQRLVG